LSITARASSRPTTGSPPRCRATKCTGRGSNAKHQSRKGRPTTLSDDGRQTIAAELAQLRQRRARLFGGLKSDEDPRGDRGDAADEIQQAEELAFVDRRIGDLERLLHDADAVTPGLLSDGTKVTLRFPDGETTTMRVVACVEQIASGDDETLTADSPLGMALVGHKPGDSVTYAAPSGQQSVELVSVKPPR
jgi:transcription elongation factor GreA